jgi:TolB-like protein/Tfp pilus assembly protein PilF
MAVDRVREELQKILASTGFFRAPRMQRFLTFVIEAKLSGKASSDDLKESVIGVAVFDRDPDYDLKNDPVVRVEARRLRNKLEEYYAGNGKDDTIRIDLPKGSYVPVWHDLSVIEPQVVDIVRPVATESRSKSLSPVVLAAAALLALLLIWITVRWISHRNSGELGRTHQIQPKIRSLAVLPFRNLSDDPKQQYLITGLTDELITNLAKSRDLTVISRTSTEVYTNTNKRLPEIARELHVDSIVEGTVRRASGQVRVTVQLIQAATDTHLWAQTYQRDSSDIFALQSELAEDIAREIGSTLVASPRSAAGTAPKNAAAYEAYLKGRYFWNKRTLDGLERSLRYYQEALQLDPQYAMAYAAMGDSYVLFSSYGGPSPTETLIKAREAAEHALRLDDSLAEAYTVLGAVLSGYDQDWSSASREYERAIELSPNYPTAHHWYGLHLSRIGKNREAEKQIERALRLDPLSLIINTDAGDIYYCSRKPQLALGKLHRALELDPNFAEVHLVLGKVYALQRQFPLALQEFQLAAKLFNNAPNILALVGYALARSGQSAGARAIAEDLAKQSESRYVSGADIAITYSGLGDCDATVGWLEKAYQARGKGINIIGADPLFDPCRSDSRFAAILKRLNLSAN